MMIWFAQKYKDQNQIQLTDTLFKLLTGHVDYNTRSKMEPVTIESSRLEIHYTPKHGSWLDIAEIELNVMTRQCLSRRIESIENLRLELAAWEAERNTSAAKVNWQFRTTDARVKLSSLYPKFTTVSE